MGILLTDIRCDGCGRGPNFFEWVKGELSHSGYEHWRHPGIVFREAGVPVNYDNRARCERLFLALYGHEMPEDPSYLCPQCARLAAEELPGLAAADTGEDLRDKPRFYTGY